MAFILSGPQYVKLEHRSHFETRPKQDTLSCPHGSAMECIMNIMEKIEHIIIGENLPS